MHLLFLYFYCKTKSYLFCATTVNIAMGFKPQVYSHGALDFMMQCNEQIILFSFLMLMWKSKYANASDGIKRKRNAEKINRDKYQFYLLTRIQCFKFSEQDISPYSFFRCVIWFRCGPWRLHLLIRCHPCSSFAQQFKVRRWQHPAQCVCARRSRFFTWWSLGVVKLLHIVLEVYLLIETRQRSSAWALLVENTNRTKSVFVLL